MTEATATAATISARPGAYVAHVLMVEGLDYAWTTDETGELYGGGSSTWLGQSDSELGSPFSERQILPGLILPKSFREGLDPKTGMVQSQSVTIGLIDHNDVLADLFATEGKSFDVLAETISAGTANLAATIAIVGGTTTSSHNKHIALERTGPSGERRYYPALPYDLVGFQHPCNAFGSGEDGPRPIPVSTTPLDFTGRLVTVWRIVRRDLPFPGTFSAWPLWQDQASVTGSLCWIGRLTDRGTVDGGRKWAIRCGGAESLWKRSLNALSPGWQPISAVAVSLDADQTFLGIQLTSVDSSGYNAHLSIGFRDTFTPNGDQQTWIAEMQTTLNAAVNGSISDWGSGALSAFNNASIIMLDDGTLSCRVDDIVGDGGARARIVAHELVWRAIGFDPPLQVADMPFDSEYQIRFRKLDAGQGMLWDGGTTEVPAAGYWEASVDTAQLGNEYPVEGPFPRFGDRNGGSARLYRPINEGTPQILRGPKHVPQYVRLGFDQPFIEREPMVQWGQSQVNGEDVSAARYFAITGQRAVGTPAADGQVLEDGKLVDYDSVEADDYVTVARAAWAEVGVGGLVEEDGRATVAIERYEDPRRFGENYPQLDGEWAALTTQEDDSGLQIAPLFTIGYGASSALPRAMQCWYQLMLSTGSALGWSGSEDTSPTFTFGENQHAGQTETWCTDSLTADHGIGLPYQLVASPDSIAAEWDRVPGGRSGALSRLGLAYVGQVDSLDLLQSIMQPRGLSFSLHGDQVGVIYLAPFSLEDAQVTITENDLAAHPWDLDQLIPQQELRAVGQLDRVKLHYRWSPTESNTKVEGEYRSRDREAQARRGDVVLDVSDHGLIPSEWHAPGVDSWEGLFRELWEVERSAFFARRHFLVRGLPLNRIAGSAVHIGTRVRLTNPWPVNPYGTADSAGGYGITDAAGVVLSRDYYPEGYYVVDVLVFAGQASAPRVFMPIAKIAYVDNRDITCETDAFGLGGSDAQRFAPTWANGDPANVRILSYDRKTWYLSSVYTIAGVSGDMITLTSTPSAADVYRDRDKWIVPAEFAQQADRWPERYGSVIVLDDHSHPTGTGYPLES